MTQIEVDLTIVDLNDKITPQIVKYAILKMCKTKKWLMTVSTSEPEIINPLKAIEDNLPKLLESFKKLKESL